MFQPQQQKLDAFISVTLCLVIRSNYPKKRKLYRIRIKRYQLTDKLLKYPKFAWHIRNIEEP